MSTYVLYLPLNVEQPAREMNWRKLMEDFGVELLRERPTQATVEADPEEIERLRRAHPELGVTPLTAYRKVVVS